MGTAKVGVVCGFPSIVLLDQSGRCAEARRLDNIKYPAISGSDFRLPERKTHTLRHSNKHWPTGILPYRPYLERCQLIAMVEGSADYFASLHFAHVFSKSGIVPAAVLSRAVREFHPEALELFRGKRVRIFPHDDPDGGSYRSALVWAKQLKRLECDVDFFVFKELRKSDGSPVKDLNDCAELAPEFSDQLEGLFP